MDKAELEKALQRRVVLVIPWPYPLNRYKSKRNRPVQKSLILRCTEEEVEVLKLAAHKAGCSVAHLLRHCALYAANAILKDEEIKLEPGHPAATSRVLVFGDGKAFSGRYRTSGDGQDDNHEDGV